MYRKEKVVVKYYLSHNKKLNDEKKKEIITKHNSHTKNTN